VAPPLLPSVLWELTDPPLVQTRQLRVWTALLALTVQQWDLVRPLVHVLAVTTVHRDPPQQLQSPVPLDHSVLQILLFLSPVPPALIRTSLDSTTAHNVLQAASALRLLSILSTQAVRWVTTAQRAQFHRYLVSLEPTVFALTQLSGTTVTCALLAHIALMVISQESVKRATCAQLELSVLRLPLPLRAPWVILGPSTSTQVTCVLQATFVPLEQLRL